MAARDPGKRKQAPPMISQQTGTTTKPLGTLESDLQAHIGRQLRAVYDEVVSEPVPEKFLRLLEELERKKAGEH
jgi:hypothetical protein